MRLVFSLLVLSLGLGFSSAAETAASPQFKVLVFSKTTMFRHDSITNGIVAIQQLGREHSFQVDATEDASLFTPANLKNYKVVIFLNTSGDLFNSEQENSFKQWLESGGALVGVHAAIPGKVATEGDWSWYTDLFCTEFHNHPDIAEALLHVEDRSHPSTRALPEKWRRTDEWYNFTATPRGKVHVLATLDEQTYKGGTMGTDHPVVWWRDVGKARVWYTALGHTAASYKEPLYLQHLLGGIFYAARAENTSSPLSSR